MTRRRTKIGARGGMASDRIAGALSMVGRRKSRDLEGTKGQGTAESSRSLTLPSECGQRKNFAGEMESESRLDEEKSTNEVSSSEGRAGGKKIGRKGASIGGRSATKNVVQRGPGQRWGGIRKGQGAGGGGKSKNVAMSTEDETGGTRRKLNGLAGALGIDGKIKKEKTRGPRAARKNWGF